MGLQVVKASHSARRVSVGLCLAVLAAGLILACRNPIVCPLFPRCPTFSILGLHCAGCGTLRAAHALFHGHLAKALAYNPLFVVMAPVFALWIGLHVMSACTGWAIQWRPVPIWIPIAALVVLLIYSILRNIPSPRLDWLRPPSPPGVKSS